MNILLAEENAELRRFVVEQVLDKNENVTECCSSERLLSDCSKRSYDFLLLEVTFDNFEGFSLARKIRLNYPDINIIFITGFDLPEYRKEALEIGAMAFIAKDDLFALRKFVYG